MTQFVTAADEFGITRVFTVVFETAEFVCVKEQPFVFARSEVRPVTTGRGPAIAARNITQGPIRAQWMLTYNPWGWTIRTRRLGCEVWSDAVQLDDPFWGVQLLDLLTLCEYPVRAAYGLVFVIWA